MTDRILEIIQRNPSELHAAEEIAAFIQARESLPVSERWEQMSHAILVNFLHLPEEHQIHLIESMLIKRPKLKELIKP